MRLLSAIFLALALPAAAHAADAARGRYLAVLGDCAGCHTAAHGAAYAGGLPFEARFGTVYSTNITPDRRTGIGNWSADDFYRALHEGIAPGGRHLYPAFPYVYFTHVTRRDSDDLYAFLRSVKPVHQDATPNRLIFPFNLRWGLVFWNWLYLDRTPLPAPAGRSAAWQRGQYLVNGLGHCGGCHTPKDLLFGDKKGQAFTGATVQHWFASNLTSGPADSLAHWHPSDITRFLATGVNSLATAAGSMQEKVTLSTSRMSDADRAAIAAYLKSLPPRPAAARTGGPPDARQMAAGQAVFVQHCVVCHQQDGTPSGYPRLGGDTLVIAQDPTTVMHIILEGAQSPVTSNAGTIFSMPSFATLTDREIADVASYVRNSWGNHAPTVSRRQAAALRAAIAP